jgi:hypothetical protein
MSYEQIQETGSFTLILTIARPPKNKWDLAYLLEEALIQESDHEWILSLQEKYVCEGLQETAECIILHAEINGLAYRQDPLVYELELEADPWTIEKAEEEWMKNQIHYQQYQKKMESEQKKMENTK